MVLQPYYHDDMVTLYNADMRDVMPLFSRAQRFSCVVTDPPYEETSLDWDRWPDQWPSFLAEMAVSMWCFGSLRMLLNRRDEFAGWKLSQDVVWEKHNGTGFARDRFRKVHELATHWYRGSWVEVYRDVPREPAVYKRGGAVTKNPQPSHTGRISDGLWIDNGTRLARSVLRAPSVRRGIHRTEKPVKVLDQLIRYSCPRNGTVLDPFAGSCSTGVAARLAGRRAVLIEADEATCEKAVIHRLAPLAQVAA